MSNPALPLDGIRVLDLATVLAGPVTTTLLGDFGADVVKIEEPGRGDFTRGRASKPGGRSPQWLQEGRNKRSVTLNLRAPEGRQLLERLIPDFDIIVTNYRPPTLERWGLGPDRLRALHPRGIFVFVTGYGLSGPYSDRGAFDRIASAFSGLTHVSGEAEGDPVRSGYSVIDFMASYMGAYAAMLALYHRDQHSGSGQVIDLALYEAGFRAAEDALINYSVTGEIRERTGNRNVNIVPASDFATADDRRVSVHAGTDELFLKLCHAIDRPDLATDDRFRTRAQRSVHQDELYPTIVDWMRSRKADDIVDKLTNAGVPAAPIMNIADIASDPHYRDRGTIVDLMDEEFGRITTAAPLPFMSETPGEINSLGPHLGEHTADILMDRLKLSPGEIEQLRTDGVI